MTEVGSGAQLRDSGWQFLIAQRSEIQRLVDISERKDEFSGLLYRLVLYLGERGRGVLALLGADLAWDAEIVLRSYYECASKILYLTLSPEDDQVRLVHEFEVVLAEASDKKRARKAGLAENAAREEAQGAKDVFRLMRSEKMIRKTVSIKKSERQLIEARWSFSGIIDQLAKVEVDGQSLNDSQSLLHIYGMASHLIHSDAGALDFMEDRAMRDPEELAILEAAHMARIVSDLVSLGAFCSASIGRALGGRKGWMAGSLVHLDNVAALSKELGAQFYDSQREFYDRMLDRN